MKFINKKIESLMVEKNNTKELKNIETAKGSKYKFDQTITGYELDGQKKVMEFLSRKPYEKLYSGSSISYFWTWYKSNTVNEYFRNQLSLNAVELVIREMEHMGKEKYLHLPEEEQEQAWYQNWYGSKEFLEFLNTGLTFNVNQFYKKKTNFEDDTTLIEILELKEIFPKTDRIFVCEELKVIILIQMVPIYGTKDIDTTLNADYELSPYFNEKYMKDEGRGKDFYYRILKKVIVNNQNTDLNQQLLLEHISKKKNENKIGLRSSWSLYGRNYSNNRYGMKKTLNEIESEDLKEILKTYVILPGELMYKPFINENDLSVKKYNISAAGAHCAYKQSHVTGSTREELQKRLDKAGYVTDYYNIDRSNTYDFSID